MKLSFTKMQGAGNDFVVIDATRTPFALSAGQIRFIADRRFGVGCDQMLVVESPRVAGTDFHYRIFNADGGEVQQCGNGARCFVRFVHDHRLTTKPEIRVGTASGVIVPRLEPDGDVTVNMGPPEFEPARVPFPAPARAENYVLQVAERPFAEIGYSRSTRLCRAQHKSLLRLYPFSAFYLYLLIILSVKLSAR